jgi:predicted ABC-type ATPase
MNSHQPQLWVFAGPNGAGKSTLVRHYKVAERIPVVNADDIADTLRRESVCQSEAAVVVQAGRQAVAQRDRLLYEGRTFAIETTLTGHSELELMRAARLRSYKINLVYVRLSSAELSNSRVALRVAMGGHDVPEQDIFRRFGRSLENLPAAIKASDRVRILDNSGKRYRLMNGTDCVASEPALRPLH